CCWRESVGVWRTATFHRSAQIVVKTGNTPEQRDAFRFSSMQLRLHQSSAFRERN
ncbi:unnamed protein product, partial [Ectocarpus sp. 13 AM-2016]